MLCKGVALKLLSIAVLVHEYLRHGNVVGLLHGGGDVVHVLDVGHGLVYNVQHAEQEQEGDHHRAAAAHGLVALLLELCKFDLLLFLVVLVFLLDLPYLGGENGGFCCVFLLLYRKRKHCQLYDKSEHQDRNAYACAGILADHLIDTPEDITERCADDAVQELYCVHVLSFRIRCRCRVRTAQRVV